MAKATTTEELLRAIRAHCMECSGGSAREVHRCGITGCALRPYRESEAQALALESGASRWRSGARQTDLFDALRGDSEALDEAG